MRGWWEGVHVVRRVVRGLGDVALGPRAIEAPHSEGVNGHGTKALTLSTTWGTHVTLSSTILNRRWASGGHVWHAMRSDDLDNHLWLSLPRPHLTHIHM